MKNTKIKLEKLEVQSFVTNLSKKSTKTLQGGADLKSKLGLCDQQTTNTRFC